MGGFMSYAGQIARWTTTAKRFGIVYASADARGCFDPAIYEGGTRKAAVVYAVN